MKIREMERGETFDQVKPPPRDYSKRGTSEAGWGKYVNAAGRKTRFTANHIKFLRSIVNLQLILGVTDDEFLNLLGVKTFRSLQQYRYIEGFYPSKPVILRILNIKNNIVANPIVDTHKIVATIYL